ncbi:2S seed storage protein 5-like [Pistacia vera]|uniref:2S seed storage protein 5-like n=1 Tax=Pistacia vera TaxID=55513 RepID=UPI0012637199|nr:2S seed storage protein 5-like [Pistacia vera]
MAKLVLLLSAFAFLLLAANASIYRATVEVEGENLSSGQSCQKQFEEQQKFKHCQMYVQQEVQKSQDGHSLTARINQRQQCFKQCCQELQEVDKKCRCQNLEQMVKRQQQQGQFRGEKLQELYETASELPRMCNISPSQGCQFSSPYWSY